MFIEQNWGTLESQRKAFLWAGIVPPGGDFEEGAFAGTGCVL